MPRRARPPIPANYQWTEDLVFIRFKNEVTDEVIKATMKIESAAKPIVSIRLSASGAVHRDYLKTRDVVTYFEPGTAFKYIESFTTRTRPLPAEVEDPPSLLYTNVKPFERFTSIIGSSYHNRAKFEVGSTFTSERARGLVFGLLREFEIRAADLRSELNETIDIIQGLKTRMAELETRMAESETRGDELETSAAAAETRAARAEERVAELEAEVERMNIEEMDVDAGGEGEGDGDEEFGGVEQRSRVVEEREQDEVQEYDAGEQEGGNYLGFDDGKGVADVSGDDAGDVSMIAIQGTPDRPHFIGSPPAPPQRPFNPMTAAYTDLNRMILRGNPPGAPSGSGTH